MHNKYVFPVFVLTLAVLAGAYFLSPDIENGGSGYATASELNGQEPAAGQEEPMTSEDALEDESEAADAHEINAEAALSERILGDVNAPIRISEHSSFTCGHCGNFHRISFNTVKEELLDTGKAYLVFSDFPLNAPALHASMIARCLPQDQYFDFVQTLFERQEEWAYDPDYIKFLQAQANDAGLSTELIKECLENEEIQNGILAGMTAAKTQFKIDSTPTFVVNNKTLIRGALPPEEFIQKVNEAVE